MPEFRISEHVADFQKYGLSAEENTDLFEIPGTGINSAVSSSFWRDYSNSEFCKGFLNIKKMSAMLPREIEIVCEAAVRFNPYKGFYPVDRSLDLVQQWSSSYASGLSARIANTGSGARFIYVNGSEMLTKWGSRVRPAIAPLFAPGILYNSIKAGMAVDFPIITDGSKMLKWPFASGSMTNPSTGDIDLPTKPGTFALTINPRGLVQADSVGTRTATGYDGGQFWDKRLPFETIINPAPMANISFVDLEANHSCSLFSSASFDPPSDNLYTLMASNYFGEIGNFFLDNSEFTKLESRVISDKLVFETGSIYAARIKLRRSVTGPRDYRYEIDSRGETFSASYGGDNLGAMYRPQGGAPLPNTFSASGLFYPLPQDPRFSPGFQETFTLYSRPTAFGPPVSALRMTGSDSTDPWATTGAELNVAKAEEALHRPQDSFNGYNWSFTPPYTNGEAWADIIFKPRGDKEYNIEDILAASVVKYWRFDPGGHFDGACPAVSTDRLAFTGSTWPASLSGLSSSYMGYMRGIYDGENINKNAMQISASINLFGLEKVQFTEKDKFGNISTTRDTAIGTRWIIQPKFETPHLNFNGELTQAQVPTYGSASVPIGIWHQFGKLPTDPETGIFLEIGDIPDMWQKYHYERIFYDSPYVNLTGTVSQIASPFCKQPKAPGSVSYPWQPTGERGIVKPALKSLTNVFGFNEQTKQKRLGEIADSRVLREAIVAIPYVLEQAPADYDIENIDPNRTQYHKKFISIPKERIDAARQEREGSSEGDSLETAGSSIRKLLQKMDRYVLPPQFDFKTNKKIDPIVMYIFEFEYKLDKDDLSYIWQNLAPRDYRQLTFQKSSIAHELMDTELLSGHNLMDSSNLRWMVFKVKQKSQTLYEHLVVAQAGEANKDGFIQDRIITDEGYKVAYNWPYDYVSFVEMIKMDAKVLYGGRGTGTPGGRLPPEALEAPPPVLETPGLPFTVPPAVARINESVSERITNMPRVARAQAAQNARARRALPGVMRQTTSNIPTAGKATNKTNTQAAATSMPRFSIPGGSSGGGKGPGGGKGY